MFGWVKGKLGRQAGVGLMHPKVRARCANPGRGPTDGLVPTGAEPEGLATDNPVGPPGAAGPFGALGLAGH
eukprot:9443308-Alexandrium_andersonii.AAC.1